MPEYTKVNLKTDVEDMAPRFGLAPGLESRFARGALALEQSGLSYFRIAPEFRVPFGHTHETQEEVYLVISGSAIVNLDGEEIELRAFDALRIPPGTARGMQGGREGAEMLAFGAPNTENKDLEMLQDWWGG